MRDRPSLSGALGMLILVVGGLIWWFTSLTNGDPLWFLPVFNHQADRITVYWDGRTIVLTPGDAGYEPIMAAFADGIAHWSGYESGVGLSDESLDRYRQEWRLLELHYDEPVLVHTRHLYPKARNFYIPLSGTHAEYRRVFAGLTDAPRIGVLNLSETRFTRLLKAVEDVVRANP